VSRPAGRVFCLAKNYAAHAAEMNSDAPAEPVVFMKPASSVVPPGARIRFPGHGGELHHEVEIVLRIGVGGRCIPRDHALAHIDAVTVGLDLTLRDLQRDLKAAGLPWEACKAFDQSAPVGEFLPITGPTELDDIEFGGWVNGEARQRGNTRNMIFPMDVLVAHLSNIWTLEPGDLVFTGTPEGVGPLVPGDRIEVEASGIGEFAWEIAPAESS